MIETHHFGFRSSGKRHGKNVVIDVIHDPGTSGEPAMRKSTLRERALRAAATGKMEIPEMELAHYLRTR